MYEAFWGGLSDPLTTMQAEKVVWQELEAIVLNDELL